VKLIALTATSDAPVIARDRNGALRSIREPKPGELYASMYRQIDALVRWSGAAGMPIVPGVADTGTPGPPVRGILAVEGCDFLEGRIERVQEAYSRGIRSLQLVHYRVNELGDIQTSPAVHGGLTAFGREVVREMNRLGIVIDVAHARFEVVKGVVETTTQPIILSHSNIMESSGWARSSALSTRAWSRAGQRHWRHADYPRPPGDDITGYVHHVCGSWIGRHRPRRHGTDMDGIGLARSSPAMRAGRRSPRP
jgi:membrane dipeptidase